MIRVRKEVIIRSFLEVFLKKIKHFQLSHLSLPWCFFCMILAGLFVGVVSFYFMNEKRKETLEFQFMKETEMLSHLIENSFSKYSDFLNFFFTLFDSQEKKNLSQDTFQAWYEEIQKSYPEVTSLEYMPFVKKEELAQFQKKSKALYPNYNLKKRGEEANKIENLNLSSAKEKVFPIYYMAPFDEENKNLLGVDAFSSSSSRRAIEKALDQGFKTFHYSLAFFEDNKMSYENFFIFKPVYKKSLPIGTKKERWKALEGIVSISVDFKHILTKLSLLEHLYLDEKNADEHVHTVLKQKKWSFDYDIHLYYSHHEGGDRKLVYANCHDEIKEKKSSGRIVNSQKEKIKNILIQEEGIKEDPCPYAYSTFSHYHFYHLMEKKWELYFHSKDEKVFSTYWEGLLISVFFFFLASFLTHFFLVDLRRREAKIQSNQRFFSAVSKTIIEALVTINDVGDIQFANSAFLKVFGYEEEEEVLGKNIKLFMPKKWADSHDYYLRHYKETGVQKIIGKKRKELEGMRKNGENFPLNLGVNEVVVDGEKIFVGTIQDLTTEKKAEDNLHKTIEKLSHVNSDLEYFNYIASHDLQEPLRVISNFTNLLNGKLSTYEIEDEKVHSYINFILSATQRMRTLLEDLLQYSRMAKFEVKFKKVNLKVIVSNVLENLQSLIAHSGAQVVYKDLPTLESEPAMLTCLLQNLIGNGMKYQSPNTKPHVVLDVQEKEEKWLFSVKGQWNWH